MKGVKTGGRKKGSKNKRVAIVPRDLEVTGLTPLEYMLNVMTDESQPSMRRDWAAEKAAPYIHARKQTTEHTGEGGGPIEIRWLS